MSGIKDYSPIEVTVPQPWRTIGRIFNFIGLATIFAYIWFLFIDPIPPDDEMVGVACFSFLAIPLFFLYTIPVFLNRYPSWLVRLVGREYLFRLIADSKRHLGQNRKIKAQLFQPKNWFNDKRIYWLVVIIGCAILGFLRAIGWL